MPIRTVPKSDIQYYLISFDKEGRERTDSEPDRRPLSEKLLDALARLGEAVTDVFVLSHGWKGDVPAAIEQYDRWIGAMLECATDRDRIRQLRPGFRPLLVGLHWPSQPWGDEEIAGGSFAVAGTGASLEAMVDTYAERIANTPAAIAAIRTIFQAALEDMEPNHLPREVVEAYDLLNREARLGVDGEGGAPGSDREDWDAETLYQESLDESASFGGDGIFGAILSPLRQLSFWKMKDRARRFGEQGGSDLLRAIQTRTQGRDVRIHLMGHSFGCIVVSATIAGRRGSPSLVRPVDSVALVQGALSLWSYSPDIPVQPGTPGYFHKIIGDRRVRGPIITTLSEHDTAVGRFYPIGAGIKRQVNFAAALPKYGGVGAFGAQGLDTALVSDVKMLPVDGSYGFVPGRVYNLEASNVIRIGGGASGAHSDISHPEVAHAVWEAASTL